MRTPLAKQINEEEHYETTGTCVLYHLLCALPSHFAGAACYYTMWVQQEGGDYHHTYNLSDIIRGRGSHLEVEAGQKAVGLPEKQAAP